MASKVCTLFTTRPAVRDNRLKALDVVTDCTMMLQKWVVKDFGFSKKCA